MTEGFFVVIPAEAGIQSTEIEKPTRVTIPHGMAQVDSATLLWRAARPDDGEEPVEVTQPPYLCGVTKR